jgi:hypothetical protein
MDTSASSGGGLSAILGGGDDTGMDAGLGGGGDLSAGGSIGVRDGQGGRERRRPGHSGHTEGHPDLNARRGNSVVRDSSNKGWHVR